MNVSFASIRCCCLKLVQPFRRQSFVAMVSGSIEALNPQCVKRAEAIQRTEDDVPSTSRKVFLTVLGVVWLKLTESLQMNCKEAAVHRWRRLKETRVSSVFLLPSTSLWGVIQKHIHSSTTTYILLTHSYSILHP